MQVKVSQAKEIITACFKAKLVPMLRGSPGCGKSDLYKQLAQAFNLLLIDKRLSQCDPTDLAGFPYIFGSKAGYVPFEDLPVEGDPIPEGYDGWLLLLDEFNAAVSPTMQAASYKLVLDRMAGNKRLHPKCVVGAAGNLDTDNALAESMSTALQSRMVHLELVLDHEEWLAWAMKFGIDHRITDYIKFKPGSLYTFQPDHSDNTYACPRTWEFSNRLLKAFKGDVENPLVLPSLAGTVSEGIAREFLGYTKIYKDLIKVPQIVADPEGITVPSEPAVLWALTGSIAHNATMDNFTGLHKFVKRMPLEFQVITMKETVHRNREMLQHAAVRKWISESAIEYI